jgi:hypothetical protein
LSCPRHKCGQLFLGSDDMKATVPAHGRDRNTLLKLFEYFQYKEMDNTRAEDGS